MKRKITLPLMTMVLLLIAQSGSYACTGILLEGETNDVVHGRTLEFNEDIEAEIAFIPQDIDFKGQTGLGDGLSYASRYAMLGVIAHHKPIIMDGINEKGLSVGAFYFAKTAGYATVTENNKSKALSPVDFPNWILSQFESIDRIKRALNDKEVVIVDTVISEWGEQSPPFHYIVYDAKGNSIVIDPIDGELVIRDNPYGVVTNDPEFRWHETNIRNYISLSPEVVESIDTKDDVPIEALGLGNGMFGLPGDFTSPSRFVRAWAFSQAAPPFKSLEEGIHMVFHILNNFDIPPGITRSREKEGGTEKIEITWLTVARDPQKLSFYYKTYNNQTIKVIHMYNFDKEGDQILIVDTMNN